MGDVDADLRRELRGGEMREAGEAGRAVIELAGLALGEFDQLLDALRRQARIDHQHIGRGAEHRDRLEILDRVVGQLGAERGRDRMGAAGDQPDRVAVGGCLGDDIDADSAAGAGPVLDHHLLAELLAERLRHEACDHVGSGAGREGHDDTDRPVGIGALCRARARAGDRKREQAEIQAYHGATSLAMPVMRSSKSLQAVAARRSAQMRQQQDVVEVQKLVVVACRLLVERIEREAADLPGVQCLDQRRAVDDVAGWRR